MRNLKDAWLGVTAIVIVFAAGFAVVTNPFYAIVGVLGIAVAVLLATKPDWFIPITLVLACVAVPAGTPTTVGFSGFTFPIYEMTLFVAFVLAVRRGVGRYTKRRVTFFALWMLCGLSVSFLDGLVPVRIIGDIRTPIQLVMALVVAAVYIETDTARKCAEALKWTLWFSAILTILASVSGLKLAGRSGDSTLIGNSDAVRFLTATNFPALGTVCVCAALIVLGRASLRSTAMWTIPALIILLMAFSRNHIIGLALAVLVALVATRDLRTIMRAVIRVAVAAAVLVLVTWGVTSSVFDDFPGHSWAKLQADSYASRVLEGLTEESRERDSSALYREEETQRLTLSISEAPVMGHGFGYAYKPAEGQRGSWFYDQGPYYAHNFYLWALVKSGVVGLFLFLAALARPLIRPVLRPTNPVATSFAAAAIGLLGVSWVAPMPLGSPSAVVLGALVGVVCGLHIPTRAVSEEDTGIRPESAAARV
ncbi:O-antigen ligase family protein [Rhodococcus opacus]|uniref:O-antigen ligase family protein n=1 Tax=Rhodococcus opacus TaxID=37919 RepID=UPI001FF19D9E|nr:O-antigen ligase family protein [Rhodococcus opacus]UOT05840.1 O-antigen ligase family protein [Rhodococcus opacus]